MVTSAAPSKDESAIAPATPNIAERRALLLNNPLLISNLISSGLISVRKFRRTHNRVPEITYIINSYYH